ncbi:MAG: hypothetical protein RTV31_10010 [Candidatus Thorarchaeota archaeon]
MQFIKKNKMILTAILVGVILFITDLVFGWITFLTGPFPMIFVITIVVGIIAGQVGDAVWATFLTWILGILLGCLLAPIIFAEFWTDDGFLPLLPLMIMMWSTRGIVVDYQFEGSIFEAIAVAAGLTIIWLVLTPGLYLFSFAVAAISGFIGKKIHERLGITQTEMVPPPVETYESDSSYQ